MAKDRFEGRTEELVEEIVEFIESKRASTLWTDDDCDIEYTRLRKRFPIFKHAVDNPQHVVEAMAAELKRRRELRQRRAAPANTIVVIARKRTA